MISSKLEIEYVNFTELKVPEWKATHILRPDLLVLSSSLTLYGFIEPIHVRSSTGEIIDGSERYKLATTVKQIISVVGATIPIVRHDVDSLEAMMMHLQLNRGRGSVVAKPMSRIIRDLHRSRRYGRDDFNSLLCMKIDELELMIEGSLFKIKKLDQHNYSRAWVPIEAPPGTIDRGLVIERPPNADR